MFLFYHLVLKKKNYYPDDQIEFTTRQIHAMIGYEIQGCMNYAMKKENGKWKIDGVCCIHHKINHKQCWEKFETFFPNRDKIDLPILPI